MIGFFANLWSWLAMHPFASMILIVTIAAIVAVMDWKFRGER